MNTEGTDSKEMSSGQKIKFILDSIFSRSRKKTLKINIGNIECYSTKFRKQFKIRTLGVHRCPSVAIFFLLTFFNISLFAREITILPAHVTGEEPAALKKKDNLSTGVAELIGYYATENFVVDMSDPEKVKGYLSEVSEEVDRKPSRSLLNGVCEEFSSDFIVKSEIIFEDKISILTEVYNCRGKVIASNESLFTDNFYLSMEKHTKKTLSFLVPKNKSVTKVDSSGEEEIVFLLDLSGSLTREVKSVVNYIFSITGTRGLSLGAILVRDNSIKVIKPSFNHAPLKEELGRIKQGGDVGVEKISQALVKSRSELGTSKLAKKKLIIVTDARSNPTYDYGYLSAVQTMKEIGYNTFIITGSFFDYKSMNLHKKAAKSAGNNLQQIMHFQKVGTTKGYKMIYLFDRNIYFDDSLAVNLKELNLKEISNIEEGQVLSKFDFPHPDNMSEIFEKVQGQRVIEKQSIFSNIDSIVEKLVQNKSNSQNSIKSKVLIKTGANSFWLGLNFYDESLENKDVSFRVSFIKDEFSANGFTNIPTETIVARDNVPKLLVLEPGQIRNYLKSNASFTCFISGKILEVK